MGARGVGKTVTAAAIGAVVGVALGVGIDRAYSRLENGAIPWGELVRHLRESESRVVAESRDATAESAPARVRDAIPTANDSSNATADAVANADDSLESLRARIADLEAEVARLRAQLADGSPRRHTLRERLAANTLEHARLYEEVIGLIEDDPESVAEDPRRAFELILRLIDETGLAGAKLDGETRNVHPEPAAPDLGLSLHHGATEMRVRVDDGPDDHVRFDQVDFAAELVFPKVPEGWLGGLLDVQINLIAAESENGIAYLDMRMSTPWSLGTSAINWQLQDRPNDVHLNRSPYRGNELDQSLTAADITKERAWLDRMFQQLMTRVR